jgi:hypothetical protein
MNTYDLLAPYLRQASWELLWCPSSHKNGYVRDSPSPALPPARQPTPSLIRALCAIGSVDKRQLEAYFGEHQIQEKLNGMLNELVTSRPVAPFGWLARRMRRDESGHTPAVGTLPLLAGPAANAFGLDLEKQWAFALGLQGSAAPAAAAGGPPKAAGSTKRAGADGVQLTLEKAGQGVLLCIRPAK